MRSESLETSPRASKRPMSRSPRSHATEASASSIGSAFLSAVAGRFGLWSGHVNWDNFARFIQRTAELNGYAPAALVPILSPRR